MFITFGNFKTSSLSVVILEILTSILMLIPEYIYGSLMFLAKLAPTEVKKLLIAFAICLGFSIRLPDLFRITLL